jgi:predicted Kef-type K+ transport protein
MTLPAWVDFLTLILLGPILFVAGRAAQAVRLPLITGYVLAGIIVGPYSLGILSTEGLQALVVVRSHTPRSPTLSCRCQRPCY